MATWLHRIIEVRNDDGEWEMVKWYIPFKERWEGDKPDIDIPEPCPMSEHNMICNNAPVYRRLLRENDTLSDRGVPTDCSNEAKSILEENKEWKYGYTYVTLSELDSWLVNMKQELIKNIKKEYDKEEFNKINDKLDCILQHKEYVFKKKNKECYDDEEYSMLSYYMNEGVDELISLLYEIDWVNFVKTECYDSSYVPSSDVRILYFYS